MSSRRSLKRTTTIRNSRDRRRFESRTTSRGLRTNKVSMLRQVARPSRWLNLNTPQGPFPSSTMVTMKYGESVAIDPAAGQVAGAVFNINSAYEPRSGGHQPRGFDQIAGLYQHFTVVGCAYKVTFVSGGAGVADNLLVGTRVTTQSTISTGSVGSGIPFMIESPRTKYTVVPDTDGTGGQVLTGYQAMNEFFGKNVKDEDDTSHSSSANPADLCYLHVTGTTAGGTADASPFTAIVELRYYVECSELKALGTS